MQFFKSDFVLLRKEIVVQSKSQFMCDTKIPVNTHFNILKSVLLGNGIYIYIYLSMFAYFSITNKLS